MQYTYECICKFIYAESNLIHILSSVYVCLYIWLSTVNAIAAKEPNKRDLYKVPYKRDSLLHIQIRYTKNYSHTLHYILGKRKRKTQGGETGRQTCRCGYVCLGAHGDPAVCDGCNRRRRASSRICVRVCMPVSLSAGVPVYTCKYIYICFMTCYLPLYLFVCLSIFICI